MLHFLAHPRTAVFAGLVLAFTLGLGVGWTHGVCDRQAIEVEPRVYMVPCPQCGGKARGCGCQGGQCCPGREAPPPGPEPKLEPMAEPRLWLPPKEDFERVKTSYAAAPRRGVVYAVIQQTGGYRVALCSDQLYPTPEAATLAVEKVRAYCQGRGINVHVYVPFPCFCRDCACPAPCPCGLCFYPAPVAKVEGKVVVQIGAHLGRIEALRVERVKKFRNPKKRLRQLEKRK